jgi:hypothetical protein
MRPEDSTPYFGDRLGVSADSSKPPIPQRFEKPNLPVDIPNPFDGQGGSSLLNDPGLNWCVLDLPRRDKVHSDETASSVLTPQGDRPSKAIRFGPIEMTWPAPVKEI